VVDRHAGAVDLDHREPFAVDDLERRIAGDVDLAERKRELVPEAQNRLARALAQVAACRVVEGDFYG
jgi:hypothetical protein